MGHDWPFHFLLQFITIYKANNHSIAFELLG